MTGYADTTVRVWDLKGELLATTNTNNMGNAHVALSPCGRFFAASGSVNLLGLHEIINYMIYVIEQNTLNLM